MSDNPNILKGHQPMFKAKKKSWFKGFIDFMSSDIGRHNPYDRMIKIPEPRNPPKSPPFRTVHGEKYFVANQPINFKELKEVDIKKKYGIKDKDIIMPDFFKKSMPVYFAKKESWFSKFKRWLKYWFTPRESYNKIVEGYRNSREFNEAINKLSDSLKFKGHSNPPPPPERTEKQTERFKEAMTFEEMINGEKVLVFIDHKALRKLIHGKKRYSISTPTTRAWQK